MDPYSSEQEQVERIKRWWNENGKSLVFGLVLGIGGLSGYRYWDNTQNAQAEQASVNYEQMLAMMTERRLDDARDTGQAILDNYPDTTYAPLARLLLAKMAVDNKDYASAKALLGPLTGGERASEISAVARARMARIHLAEGDSARAAELLAMIPDDAEGTRFAELRGDVLAARGNPEGARTMYLEALTQAQELGLERGAIQLKLDNLPATPGANES